jgi:hypothetical protein
MIFSSNIIKPPSPEETEREKKKEKVKLQESSNKRGSQYFERRKHFNIKNPF